MQNMWHTKRHTSAAFNMHTAFSCTPKYTQIHPHTPIHAYTYTRVSKHRTSVWSKMTWIGSWSLKKWEPARIYSACTSGMKLRLEWKTIMVWIYKGMCNVGCGVSIMLCLSYIVLHTCTHSACTHHNPLTTLSHSGMEFGG